MVTNMNEIIDFSDYITLIESDIVRVDNQGITYKTLKGTAFIDFKECASNYKKLHGGSGNCVGDRDMSGNPDIGFYTAPIPTRIFFLTNDKLKKSLINEELHKRVQDFQTQINNAGYIVIDFDKTWKG